MAGTPHVLIVEDDASIGALIRAHLDENGFTSTVVDNGTSMDRVLQAGEVDIIILDLMLPGEDGLSICRRIRETLDVPIIVVTALGEEPDRVRGLEAGADDYLAKPFGPRELVARIRAVLRRHHCSASRRPGLDVEIRFGRWVVDVIRRQVRTEEGERIPLTSGEFDLLMVLCRNPGTVLGRDVLLEAARGRTGGPLDRSVDVTISRLRRKLIAGGEPVELIATVRNAGYSFVEEVRRP